MGLLGWIKKDKRHQRRDSAPPAVGQSVQDVAYREALAKFNDWRAQQRLSDITPNEQLPRSTAAPHEILIVGGGGTAGQPRLSLAHTAPIKEESSGDCDSDCEDDFSSDLEVARDERKLLTSARNASRFEVPKSPRYARHHRSSTVATVVTQPVTTPGGGGGGVGAVAPPKKPKRSVEFYRNINRIPIDSSQTPPLGNHWNNGTVEKNHSDQARFSLPIAGLGGLTGDRNVPRNPGKLGLPKPNNTIYENEVAEFEANQLNGTSFGDSYVVQSPPRLFYKANSSPYTDVTPKKQNNLKMRPRSFKDKPAPPPPVKGVRAAPSSCPPKQRKYSDSDSPLTGSYRKYELNSSSVDDEHVISSRAYRGSLQPGTGTGVEPEVPEIGDHTTPNTKQRQSLSYQTVVNKHGDLVDYALPFSDPADTTTEGGLDGSSSQTALKRRPGQDTLAEIRTCEQLVNDNFQFLQCTALGHDESGSIITEPISVLKGRSGRLVTDLDRSNNATTILQETDEQVVEELEREDRRLQHRQQEIDAQLAQLALQQDPQDILLELDSLQKWSKSIQLSDDFLQTRYAERNLLECFRRMAGARLPTCHPNEVRYRVGCLRSAFASPLELSGGLFRGAPVTLRKYSLHMERSLYFAEEACRRDFEVLAEVRHPAMATLMAVAYDGALNQATLLLEPFDFTLFDYIHKMNKRLALVHAVTVVQQITSAVCYLQECGYVHSNISSGCILMRRYPYAVKLTSFELTTDASTDEVRREIESRYGSTSSSRNSMTSSQQDELKKITTYARLIKNDEQFLRDKYRKLSRETCENRSRFSQYPAGLGSLGEGSSDYDCRGSRFLPYCKEYRERFSLFYYVAPELLVPKSSFVYPSKSTDVYSIALLLWEILNGYVPFVVYSRAELEKLHTSADLPLPMFEKERCERFRQIFDGGLGELGSRKLSVGGIVDLLDCLLLELGLEKNGTHDWLAEDYEEHANSSEVRLKNELNDVRKQGAHVEKTDKIYFHSEETEMTKATTKGQQQQQQQQQVREQPRPKKPARKIVRTTKEPVPAVEEKPPQTGGGNQLQSSSCKKSPLSSTFSLSNSAIYQTIFDFNNKFLSPRSSAKPAIYGRTSTVKKHKKPARANKKAAKELFEVVVADQLNTSFIEVDGQGVDPAGMQGEDTKNDEKPTEVRVEEQVQAVTASRDIGDALRVSKPDADVRPSSDTDAEMRMPPVALELHPSKSCDSSPGTRRRSGTPRLNNSFRFTIGDFTLPDTPIARKNKIRKHAWLSDQKLRMAVEDSPSTPEDCRSKSYFNAGLASGCGSFLTSTNLNCCTTSLQDIKPKRINISVNIIRSPEAAASPSVVVVKQNTPQEPEPGKTGTFESTLWHKEKNICERSQLRLPGEQDKKEPEEKEEGGKEDDALDDSLSIVTAHLSSVRDVIKKIETTFEKTGFDYSPARKPEAGGRSVRKSTDRKLPDGSLVVEESLLVPTKVLELEKTLEAEEAAEVKEGSGSEVPKEPIPVAVSCETEQPTLVTTSNPSDSQAVTHLNVLLGTNQLKQKVSETKPTVASQDNTPRESLAPPTVAAFAPNSQLYLRRKGTLNAGGSGSVAIHHQQTVYRESIVSSTDLSTPFLEPGLPVGPTTSTMVPPPGSGRKKKLTTRVTVNMRKISRRSSDISPATSRPNSANLDDLELPASGCITPTGSISAGCTGGPGSVRHSCGNELLRAFSKLRLIAPSEEQKGAEGNATTGRSQTPAPAVASGGKPDGRFVCCNCGNSMVPAEGFNVPAGSRIGMAAAFGEMNFPRDSIASMFEPPMTPTPASALAGRFQAMTPFQKSTEDLYIDDDFCQGLSHMGANMELVEPLDEATFLDTYGYDIYATEIYHAEEEEDDADSELHFAYRSQLTTPLASGECTDDETKFVEKCALLSSAQSLSADLVIPASPIECEPPLTTQQ